ncbi:MAG: sodium:calcium antiporter [Candidatus Methylomirabilales bacterium]
MKALLQELLTGHGPLIPFLALVSVGALIFLIASRLSRHADRIADETGLGGLWIGTVLLAASTSLPEVLTAVNAALLDAPDIGVGDIFGANMVNMMILAVLDLVFARRRILDHVHKEHAQFGLLGILLMVMAGIGILTGGWGRIGHVGLETVMIAAVYMGGLRLLYRFADVRLRSVESIHANSTNRVRLREAAGGFALGTIGLLVLTPLLVLSAEAVSLETGISSTFIGTLLVGLATTLPELSTTFSAIRLGAFDLAVGNLFGSVMFNVVVLLLMDIAYTRGPLLGFVARDHLFTILLGVTLLALGIVAILFRGRRRALPLRLENYLIVATYILGLWLLYSLGTP